MLESAQQRSGVTRHPSGITAGRVKDSLATVETDCAICAKHRGQGPLQGELVARLDAFWVYHAPPGDDGLAPLGHLLLETDRHVPYLADLSESEATALGRLRTWLAAALREALRAEFVFAAVIGIGVAHFHEHLLPRPRRQPLEVEWHRSDELLERAGTAAVRTFADLIAGRLTADMRLETHDA